MVKVSDFGSESDLDELRLKLASIAETYQKTARAFGFESSVLEEHLAEIWVWYPDLSKVNFDIVNNYKG